MGRATVLSRGRKQASSPELTNLNDSQDKGYWVRDKGYWTLVSDQSKRRSLPLASEVPLHNRYDLGLEKEDYVKSKVKTLERPAKVSENRICPPNNSV